MGKASFTKGFAQERLAEGRAPMVARIDTGDTIIDFETSFPRERAWNVYNLLAKLADEDITPKEAFDKTFGVTKKKLTNKGK